MKKISLTLWIFAVMSFVLAMTATVFNGILDQVAISLDISVADSGLLNTTYAYGAAFGVPATLIVFRRIERSRMLKMMLLITIITSLTLIFSQTFAQLLISRFIMGISANSYGVLAVATIVALSDKERLGRSMAFYIAGSSLALVIGVPLTRALSSILDWRGIFWILIGIMLVSLLYFAIFLPRGEKASANMELKNELQFFKDKNTVIVLIYTLTTFIGYGAFYTYVTPYLLLLFPSLENAMSVILVLLGSASFVGNWIGGQVSDRIGYTKSMTVGAFWQTAMVLLLLIVQPFKWLSVLSAILWLMSAWFIGLQINTGIAQATENKSSFMISINSSLIQLGGAIGSSLSAVVISKSSIQNIVFITLSTSLSIILIQLTAHKRQRLAKSEEVERK